MELYLHTCNHASYVDLHDPVKIMEIKIGYAWWNSGACNSGIVIQYIEFSMTGDGGIYCFCNLSLDCHVAVDKVGFRAQNISDFWA